MLVFLNSFYPIKKFHIANTQNTEKKEKGLHRLKTQQITINILVCFFLDFVMYVFHSV